MMPVENKLKENMSAFSKEKYFKNHLSLDEQNYVLKFPGEKLNQKIYNCVHNITEIPLCVCGKHLKFKSYKEGYQSYCSNSCKSKNQKRTQEQYEKMKISYKKTMNEKYGVDNYFQMPEIINKTKNRDWTERNKKSKETFLKKYGVDNPNKLKAVIEKRFKTNEQRYGYKYGKWYSNENRSKNEKEIETFLNDLGYETKHDRHQISPLELDIYLPKYKIAIEYNGDYWHALHNIDHSIKMKLCKEKNIKLIQIMESDYLKYKDDILKNIINVIENKSYTKNFFIFEENDGIKYQNAYWPPDQKYLGLTEQNKIYFDKNNYYLDCGKYILV